MRSTIERYRWYRDVQFAGSSELYVEWSAGIVQDPTVLALIEQLPVAKRQSNLVFAAARFVGAPLEPYAQLRPWLIDHWDEVAAIALAHATQTNEAARCATLLPLLSAIEGPIALLEVGASGGACLLPDRYSYEYVTPDGSVQYLNPDDGPSSVHLRCAIDPADAVPTRMPDVAWRAGIDLNPLSYANPHDVQWLQTLVWPEHTERRERLDAVASLVRTQPPRIVQGDALELLPAVAAEAPRDATLVVFHSAVLLYLPLADRERFASVVEALDATWISNEGEGVLPWIDAQLDPAVDVGANFIIARNREPVALVNGHGQSYRRL